MPGFPRTHEEWFQQMWGEFQRRGDTSLSIVAKPGGLRMQMKDGDREATGIQKLRFILMATCFLGDANALELPPQVAEMWTTNLDEVRRSLARLLGVAHVIDEKRSHEGN